MGDPIAVGVEQFGYERIEGPAAARTVAIDHHNLVRARGLSAAHGGVDLLGVELAAFCVQRRAAVDLIPNDDAAHAFHITHNQDAHYFSFYEF